MRIREMRKRLGLTQQQLADRIPIKYASTIAMWETGARKPRTEALPAIARALECQIDDLFDLSKSAS